VLKVPGISYDGGYAEYMIAPIEALASIPDELSAVEAGPLLCAGITTFNALRNSGARAGDLVAILGIGGLGHLAVQFARRMGFHTVAIARGKDKEKLALELGAHRYIDSQGEDAAKALTGMGGAKLILATITSGKAMTPLFNGLGTHGKFLVVGASPEPIEVTPIQLITGTHELAGWPSGSALQRAAGHQTDDRDLSARQGARGLRSHDERQGEIPSGSGALGHHRPHGSRRAPWALLTIRVNSSS
jgi:D-arabinose 1-dehydrogenase-like Zn-dependent alcohol dehydrogenase